MKNLTLLFIFLTGLAFATPAQDPQWINYDTSNSGLPGNFLLSVAIDQNGTKWIGTVDGLAAFDGSNWDVYNTSNSGLPENEAYSITIGQNGTKWMGTANEGLVSFDGSNWMVYNTFNSGLPDNTVNSIAIDGNGTKWILTNGAGLSAFDGTNWMVLNVLPDNGVAIAIEENGTGWIGTWGGGLVTFNSGNGTFYDTTNSGLPSNFVSEISIDQSGTKWIGTIDGLAAFDGNNWSVYNTSNSGLPGNRINSMAIDQNGTKWIGAMDQDTSGLYGVGLTAFDGSSWAVYNTSNSGLPDNLVNSIAIDGNGTKWIGTWGGGLAAFNENGIPVGVKDYYSTQTENMILYPNPADD